MTFYLLPDDVLSIHRTLIERFGGARPQTAYYRDLIEEAAALWESLSQNHVFIDGNKRVAVTVTAAFLRVNGYRLTFTDASAFSFLMDLYEGSRMRFDELDVWLRQHSIVE